MIAYVLCNSNKVSLSIGWISFFEDIGLLFPETLNVKHYWGIYIAVITFVAFCHTLEHIISLN